MKQIIKKLFLNIKFLINWQHTFFYIFLFFTVIYFSFSEYTVSHENINYNNILYSLGRSLLMSLGAAAISMLIGIIPVLINFIPRIKIIIKVLDNIFIFPEILYIFILLFLFSPLNLLKFILIMSLIRGYWFSKTLTTEIGEIENREFVNALYSIGLKKSEIIIKHIFPVIIIPMAIFFLETIIWFIVIEFIISFIGIIKISQYPGIGEMLRIFIMNKNYKDMYITVIIIYTFIFELSYIINNIKLKFEILFKKEI